MLRLKLMALAIVCIAGAGFYASNGNISEPAALPAGPEIEQRFLIKFCYTHYKHQTDVLRCLERRGA